MRDLNIKKDNDWILKLLAVIVLGGATLVVLIALTVVGFLMWKSQKPATPNPSSPLEPFAQTQPPAFELPNDLQSLPPAPAIEGQPIASTPPAHRLDIVAVRSFAGHSGSVLSIALAPHEQRLISGGSDKTVRLWNLDNGEEAARLEGHSAAVRCVAYAPDGKRAISASEDGTLRLWELTAKKTVRTFAGHDGAVCCAGFTPDGKHLLSGGVDRSLRVWDVETGRQLQEWYGHEAAILCLSISSDGTRALTGSADGGALCWDLKTGRPLCYLHVGQQVNFALFTPDGKSAVVGGDRPTRLCDLDSGEQWSQETGVGTPLHGAALIAEGTIVLHGGKGKRLEARRLSRRHRGVAENIDYRPNQLGQIEAHRGTITCVQAAQDGRRVLTAGEDGVIKLWNLVERAAEKHPAK